MNLERKPARTDLIVVARLSGFSPVEALKPDKLSSLLEHV